MQNFVPFYGERGTDVSPANLFAADLDMRRRLRPVFLGGKRVSQPERNAIARNIDAVC